MAMDLAGARLLLRRARLEWRPRSPQRSGPTLMLLRQRPRQSLFCGRLPIAARFGDKQKINAEAIRARYLRADLEFRWWTILDLNQ